MPKINNTESGIILSYKQPVALEGEKEREGCSWMVSTCSDLSDGSSERQETELSPGSDLSESEVSAGLVSSNYLFQKVFKNASVQHSLIKLAEKYLKKYNT